MSGFLEKLKINNEKKPFCFVKQSIDVPIFLFDLSQKINNKFICDEALKLKENNASFSRNDLIVKGFHSHYFNKSNIEPLNPVITLVELIEQKAKILTNKNYSVTEFWFIVHEKNTSHNLHNHITSDKKIYPLSAVYYANLGVNSSPIIFKNDSGPDVDLQIKESDLIIFHSGLLHYVPESKKENDRIAFVCNLLETRGL